MLKLGIVVNKRNLDGTMVLLPYIKGISDIKTNSIVKVGFSENFAQEFKILKFSAKNDKYYIKLDGINTPEQADDFKEKAIFINQDDLIFTNENNVAKFYNYKVFDIKKNQTIGVVKDYHYLPANDVIVVMNNEKEYLIPVVDDIIININDKDKIINIRSIEGLLD